MTQPSADAPFYVAGHYSPEESITYLTHRVTSLLRREVDARMVEHGLTSAQWAPMLHIYKGRATTVLELSRELNVDAGAMTRVIDRLVAKGLVERHRSESDRRVVNLALTPAGRAAVEPVPEVLTGLNNDLLAGFSRAEWQQLVQLLQRIVANGERLGQPPGTSPAP